MKLHRMLALVLAIQIAAALSALAQGNYKVEAIGGAPADVPAAIQATLDTQGVRVTNDQGAVLCEVWLLKTLPASPNPSTSSDVLYGTFPVGALVGVVHFPSATTDFRSQSIKAGFYTLRYGQIPQDGNHMGVNPYPDFLALGPVAADAALDKTLGFADLVKLSKQASGTNHPAVLSLIPVASGAKFPSAAKSDQGYWALQMSLAGKGGGSQPVALVLVGQTTAS